MTMRLLAALWHDADDVAFVRACLREGGDDHWRRVIGTGDAWINPSTHAGRRTKAYAPLVLAAFDRHGIDPGHQARATLRAWRLHEQLRLDQYRQISRRALRAVAAASTTNTILLKGLALADTVYPHPLWRHCHDIDLLIAPDVLPRIDPNTLIDSTGLAVMLHTQAGLTPSYPIPFDAVAAAATRIEINGESVWVLDRADALVHVCLRGLLRHRGPASLRWMVDAWYLLAAGVSWDRVIACVREHRVGLPVAAAMAVMTTRLGAQVPRDSLDALIAESARASLAERARLVASFTKSLVASYVRRPAPSTTPSAASSG